MLGGVDGFFIRGFPRLGLPRLKMADGPIGVRNEITRIGKYLDAGWGGQMTKETLWVVDALDDWQHQYPRDYELPRLYKRVYDTLAREDTTDAKRAQAEVRRLLLVGYPSSSEARAFLTS